MVIHCEGLGNNTLGRLPPEVKNSLYRLSHYLSHIDYMPTVPGIGKTADSRILFYNPPDGRS